MVLSADKKTIQGLFESLKVIRKGTEDDFELRASVDEKVWGVKMWDESPAKATLALYAGPEAKDLACDAADYDAEEDGGTIDEEFDDDDEDDEDDEDDNEGEK